MVDVTNDALTELMSENPGGDLKAGKNGFYAKDILKIPIGNVKARERQARITFDDIDALAASIKQHGQQQPIVVDPADEREIYYIQAGERRFRACKKLGIDVLAVVNDREQSGSNLTVLQLIENIQRDNLSPFEVGHSLQKVIDEMGITQAELSKTIGKSTAYVSGLIAVNKLPYELKCIAKSLKIEDKTLLHDISKLYAIKPKIAKKLLENRASRSDISKAISKAKSGKLSMPNNPKKATPAIKFGYINRPCKIIEKEDDVQAKIQYLEGKDTAIVRLDQLSILGFI